MTSTSNNVTRVQVRPCSDPLPVPDFYKSNPHHTAKGFQSPWPSARANTLAAFLRARLTDWTEIPLPATDALPAVRQATFTSDNDGDSDGKIHFTWLGHAACHYVLPGKHASTTILTDPVFSKRCSPVQFMGPLRYTDSPTSVEAMAANDRENIWPDLLVYSHNHYDHLDYNTVKAFYSNPHGRPRPHIFCTMGNKAWFMKQVGAREDEVTEMDWWQDRVAVIDGNRQVRVTCVPAQHFSGRSIEDRDRTLYAGWTFQTVDDGDTPGKKVYFAGDSGYRSVPQGMPKEEESTLPTCPAFQEIGDLLGPFDFAAIPIGAYLPRSFMSAVHMNPFDAALVHQQVKSKKSIGIHWGSFRLTPEDVNEPPRLLQEATRDLSAGEFDVMGIGETRSF